MPKRNWPSTLHQIHITLLTMIALKFFPIPQNVTLTFNLFTIAATFPPSLFLHTPLHLQPLHLFFVLFLTLPLLTHFFTLHKHNTHKHKHLSRTLFHLSRTLFSLHLLIKFPLLHNQLHGRFLFLNLTLTFFLLTLALISEPLPLSLPTTSFLFRLKGNKNENGMMELMLQTFCKRLWEKNVWEENAMIVKKWNKLGKSKFITDNII